MDTRFFVDNIISSYINCIKYQYDVPTAHGIHLITRAFNRQKFCEHFPKIDVHTNNPTLLYFKCLN